jgi:hypothetical protein
MGCVLLAARQEPIFLRLVVGQTPIFVSQPDAKENIRELFECLMSTKKSALLPLQSRSNMTLRGVLSYWSHQLLRSEQISESNPQCWIDSNVVPEWQWRTLHCRGGS